MGIMPFFADAQDTAERYGKYITEFQDLFRTNDVSFGSPEDFFRLAPRLARDETFREGFTSLTKSVATREEGRLTLTRMLTIVAIAMGSQDVARAGDEAAVPVSLVVVFLAGIGGWSEAESSPVATDGAVSEATREEKGGPTAPQATQSADASHTDEEREAMELEERLKAGPEENLESLTTSLFGGPAQVKEALSRLEMNTLQMKMHLDSIDSRMERIEPHLDDLKSKISASPEGIDRSETVEHMEPVPVPQIKPWPKESEEAPRPEWAESAPPMKPWPSEKEKDLVWEPRPGESASVPRAAWQVEDTPEWRAPVREIEPEMESFTAGRRTLAHGAAPLRMEPESRARFDDDPSIRVPFDRYLSQEGEPRRARRFAGALAGILVMLAIVAGLLYSRHGWEGYHGTAQSIGGAFAEGRAVVMKWVGELRTASTATSQNTANEAGKTPSNATQTQPPPSSSTQQPASAPPVATQSAPPPAAPPPATEEQPQTPAPAAEQQNQRTGEPGPSRTEQENRNVPTTGRQPVVSVLVGSGAAPESASALPPGMTTSVPVFVDEARLTAVSEPVPDYPHDALAKGVTGDVVVQAIVGRNGDVESAQIVSGPVGLLKSSIDAAKQWRFKPYVEHGTPVEFRTYIRFRYGTEE